MKKVVLKAHYIDTCYPDYLQDHHCRNGEILVSASSYKDLYEAKEELINVLFEEALQMVDFDDAFLDFSDSEIKEAIAEEINKYSLLGLTSDEDNESQIYIYLKVEPNFSLCR